MQKSFEFQMPHYEILQLSQFSWVAKIVGALIINAQSVRWRRPQSAVHVRSAAAVKWLQGDSNLRPRVSRYGPSDENVENHPGHILLTNKVQFSFVEKSVENPWPPAHW